MKITEDTPQRLIIDSRRKIIPDLTFAFFFALGSLIAASMAQEDMRDFVNVAALFLSLFFVGVGIWGVLKNASDQAVLDAATGTLTVKRRRLMGSETYTTAFSDLTDVIVHEDDDMHTVAFCVRNQDDILMETIFSTNPKAAGIARHIREWLYANDAWSGTTPPVTT